MTYKQLYDKANSLLDHNKITLGEYEEMIKPLEQEVPHWIPCSERLPEDDTEVFVYLFDRHEPYIAWVVDSRWYTEEFEVEIENEPIAWMPLPEPYNEVEHE